MQALHQGYEAVLLVHQDALRQQGSKLGALLQVIYRALVLLRLHRSVSYFR